MQPKRTLLSAFLLIATVAASAKADNVDEFIKAEMQRQHIPGLTIAVLKDGKPIKVEGYGMANIELNVPAKAETVFKIGSLSKQFIATGIMLLIEEGKLSLDDKISKFLDGT